MRYCASLFGLKPPRRTAAAHTDRVGMVAVKMRSHASLGNPHHVERFLREFRTAAIESANVVRVLEVGENPLPHLVMERLRGQDLGALLRSKRAMSNETLVELVRPVGSGATSNPRTYFSRARRGRFLISASADRSRAILRRRGRRHLVSGRAHRATSPELATIPDDVDLVLAIGLAKDPRARFSNAAVRRCARERARQHALRRTSHAWQCPRDRRRVGRGQIRRRGTYTNTTHNIAMS